MGRNVIKQDVYEAFVKDKVTGEFRFFGACNATDIDQTIKQEPIRAGIGNGIISTIQADKEIKFTITNAIANDGIIELQSGEKFSAVAHIVPVTESLIADASKKLTLQGKPLDTTKVQVINSKGETLKLTTDYTYTAGVNPAKDTITVSAASQGDVFTVYYTLSQAGAKVLDLNAESFPVNQEVVLHTIAYDPETNEVVADVYYEFPKALPDGNYKEAAKAGTNNEIAVAFTAQLPMGSKSYGKYIVVDRA